MNAPSRKLLSVFLAVAVILALCATSVFAGQKAMGVGTVTAQETALLSGTGENAEVLAMLSKETNVSVIDRTGDWYHVNYNAQYGYIAASALEVTEQTEQLNTTGLVTAGTASIRDSASLTAARIGSADMYVQLDVIGFENAWYHVVFGDKTGYIRSDGLTLNGTPVVVSSPLTEEELAAEEAAEQAAEPAASDSAAEASPAVAALPASSTSVLAVGLVSGSGVRMRSEPNTDCSILTTLDHGTALSVTGVTDGWYAVNYDDKDGYVSADYLTVSDSTEGFSCYGLVKASALNIRSAPSSDSSRVTGVDGGTYVDVSGFENGWYAVSYSGSSGYMSGDYLTLTASKPAPTPASSGSSGGGSVSLPSGGYAGAGTGTGSDIAALAENYLGVRYVYGGASPSGFDCSGFTMYVYAQFGYGLPHGATWQMSYGQPVSRGELQAGDLVFFHSTDGGSTSSASHVGIYVGGGTFIHASSGSSYCVKYSSLNESYYANHYLTARRIAG